MNRFVLDVFYTEPSLKNIFPFDALKLCFYYQLQEIFSLCHRIWSVLVGNATRSVLSLSYLCPCLVRMQRRGPMLKIICKHRCFVRGRTTFNCKDSILHYCSGNKSGDNSPGMTVSIPSGDHSLKAKW